MAARRKNQNKNEEASRYKVFTRRALLVGGAQTLMLSALAGRMYYLQVLQSNQYSLLAEDNRINLRLLPPPRGRIIDRFGVPLAVNEQNYRVLIVEEQARDVDATLALLGEVIEIDERDIERIKRELSRKRGFVPITVRENLSWKQVSQLEVNAPDLPGVSIDVGQTRHYPYGATMSHLVGYVGAVSERDLTGEPLLELPGFRIGKNGAEKMHEEQLRGAAGASQVEVNAIGRIIKEVDRQEGTPGRDVVLTIDAGLQTYTHQRLMGERSASAVILDVANGEVMALASTPSYDPTPFNTGLTDQQWKDLVSDPLSPLNNKAITGTYSPGSTFKMMVALAALEDGIQANHQAWCPGHMTLGNHRFHCWKRYGHGWMDMQDAIEQSCDVYFYDIARKLGVDKIAAMAKRFGLGMPVGLDLPGERGGVIPTRDWKLANMGEPWQGGETLVTSIGQGFVLTTPLQLAVMSARIANGGKAVVPRITRAILPGDAGPGQSAENPEALTQPEVPDFAELGVNPRHLEIVRGAMDGVVNGTRGTARGSAIKIEGWEMAGKTGTSQVRRISKAEREAGVFRNEDLPWRRRDHALFVAFAPVAEPRYAISVVVEHGGGGSSTAAPIVRDLMLETLLRDPAQGQALPLLANAEPAKV